MKNVSQSQVINLDYTTIIWRVLKIAIKKVPVTIGDSNRMVRVIAFQLFRNWYAGFELSIK
jgi:hypothetical protein